jgi:UDP-N-acetylmuramate--alanine ligase
VLVKSMKHSSVHALNSPDELASLVQRLAKPGDVVVCLGAGSITQWAAALPAQLDALTKGAAA